MSALRKSDSKNKSEVYTLCVQQSAVGQHLGAPSVQKAQSVVLQRLHIAGTDDINGKFALVEGLQLSPTCREMTSFRSCNRQIKGRRRNRAISRPDRTFVCSDVYTHTHNCVQIPVHSRDR